MLVMGMIFWFSMADAGESSEMSDGVVNQIVQKADQLFHLEMSEEKKAEWGRILHIPIRKCAHFVEYFILGVCFALHLWVCGFDVRKSILLSGLLVGLYACSDEIHQAFVPGRGPGIEDVLLDTTAGFVGSAVFRLAGGRIRDRIVSGRRRSGREKREKTGGNEA